MTDLLLAISGCDVPHGMRPASMRTRASEVGVISRPPVSESERPRYNPLGRNRFFSLGDWSGYRWPHGQRR
jgi:hypothetical protein